MPRPDEIPDSRHNGAKPLPLFRPEAILNQQHKSYGEIVLIRPLSLTLLTSLALLIVALATAFLLLGHYTEKGRVSGALVAAPAGLGDTSDTPLRAELYVPARWLASVQPGTKLAVRCPACSAQFADQPATVVSISATPSIQNENSTSQQSLAPSYKVTVTLPQQAAQPAGSDHPPQAGAPVEAEVPLGRKPLIKWLFKPSGS